MSAMENREKLRVLLQHWIDHNGGHVDEFTKWRAIMAEDHNERLADMLDRAVVEMNKVSETLRQTLDIMGGPKKGDHHDHGHHHHHHHHH